ncbi:outer dynein arm-docking complex subunit 4 isoform X4 [Pogoniulus pusillus]|uniref:outer dynein arm-docking complex subunit 4 isoform X4 n=1 Tax=Pogoniulus pusillus TaxID=488313 RepID=UPI0030B93D5A
MAAAEEKVPVGTFPSFMAEGTLLARRGEHGKALACFNNALKLRAGDKHCLVARSECYLRLGDTENALRDAEASLQNDKTFSKGLYQKAETLYTMGDFEFALVFYHRGHRLRPDLQKFALGIEKAQEAIVNCIGDLMESSTKQGGKVAELVLGGISYLESRSEFWQQQKPIYARLRERQLRRQSWARGRTRKPAEVGRYLAKTMEDIDMLLAGGSPEESCQKAERVLRRVQRWPEQEVPNRSELLGRLHSCIGSAQLEMGQLEAALQSHQMDLKYARQNKLPDAMSRALDNVGRVYARTGKFQQAIATWEKKIPMAKSSLEKAWLFHEIGRCYLQLDKAEAAKSYGEKSLQAADEEGDVKWQLHATVLVAEAQVKLKDHWAAILTFERALEKAKLTANRAAQKAITTALDEVSKSFVELEGREELRLNGHTDCDFGRENRKDDVLEKGRERGEREQRRKSRGDAKHREDARSWTGEPGADREAANKEPRGGGWSRRSSRIRRR